MEKCSVCQSSKSENENKIIECSICNVQFHQACYGVLKVKKNYTCDFCANNQPETEKSCLLCPDKSGPLKKTSNKNYIHVLCALFIPEVQFKNVNTMEPVLYGKIRKSRYTKICSICKVKKGAVIKCWKAECNINFHTTCCEKTGTLTSIKNNDKLNYVGFCPAHKKVLTFSSIIFWVCLCLRKDNKLFIFFYLYAIY